MTDMRDECQSKSRFFPDKQPLFQRLFLHIAPENNHDCPTLPSQSQNTTLLVTLTAHPANGTAPAPFKVDGDTALVELGGVPARRRGKSETQTGRHRERVKQRVLVVWQREI